MLRLRELSPSPNNTKIRMALRFKGIDFEAVPVDPADRRTLVEVSGQELSPVIEDRGIVLNDSEAILQYLDANYPDTPRLFPADRSRNRCEAWKTELDSKIMPTWLPVFLKLFKMPPPFPLMAPCRMVTPEIATVPAIILKTRKFTTLGSVAA